MNENNDELIIHFNEILLSTAESFQINCLSHQIRLMYSLLIIIIIYYNYFINYVLFNQISISIANYASKMY